MRFLGRWKRPVRVDDALPDGAWLVESEQLFARTVSRHYGSPETMAGGGRLAEDAGNPGTATCFYRKAIDMLHTAYGFDQMRSRTPAAADAWIMDGYCRSLQRSRSQHPGAGFDESVREVTHRLRSISAECEELGLDASLYRVALDRLTVIAADVPIDDVLWR
jgi:hypothetical protein